VDETNESLLQSAYSDNEDMFNGTENSPKMLTGKLEEVR